MKDGKFEKVEGSDFELEADLVLLAMGFVGPEKPGLLTDLGVELTDRGNVARDDDFQTSVPGVFVAGDMGRGQSLIVWAIAEGRAAAAGVDRYLMGRTALPAPIKPDRRAAAVGPSRAVRRSHGCCDATRRDTAQLVGVSRWRPIASLNSHFSHTRNIRSLVGAPSGVSQITGV